jgi:hypothetical protein
MKSIILITLLLVGTNFIVSAQSYQFSQGAKDSAQMGIQFLTDAWNKAIAHRDSLTLDKILAPEYTLNGSVSRSVWMNNTLHHYTTDTIELISPLNITFYGEAVKSEEIIYWKADYDGKPAVDGEGLETDIWVKRNGHWQVLMRMSLHLKSR